MHVAKVIGYQSFASSAILSAVGVSSEQLKDAQGNQANAVWISVQASTGAVRFRDDGTAPTASTGMRVPSGIPPFLYQGDLQRLRFIAESSPGGNPTLELSYVQVIDS